MIELRPVYLIVADESEEFSSALHYAARAARANGARIAILHVMTEQDFSHWGAVEAQMKKEQRQQAENFLCDIGKRIIDLGASLPSFYLEYGETAKTLLDILHNDARISKVILGGDTHGGNPGPLVTYFAGKGLGQLTVPLLIVPGHLRPETIDDFV